MIAPLWRSSLGGCSQVGGFGRVYHGVACVQRRVVYKLEQVDVLVGVVVEDDGRAFFARKLKAVLVLLWHLFDVNLNLCLLEDGFNNSAVSSLLCVNNCVFVELSLDSELYLPRLFRDFKLLSLLAEFISDLLQQIVWLEG